MGRYVYLPFRITGRKRFWRIAYPAQGASAGRYPQPPPDIREIPDTRSLYHRGYHRDSAVYGLLDGKKIGLSLAHCLMGGMRCLHSSGHGIRTERGLYHGCPLGVHHSGLHRIHHQKLSGKISALSSRRTRHHHHLPVLL